MILIFAIEIILLLVLITVWYVVGKLEMIERPAIDRDAIVINRELDDDTIEVLDGYTNILLLGSDARSRSNSAVRTVCVWLSASLTIAPVPSVIKECP